jgi:hypothetical protein
LTNKTRETIKLIVEGFLGCGQEREREHEEDETTKTAKIIDCDGKFVH